MSSLGLLYSLTHCILPQLNSGLTSVHMPVLTSVGDYLKFHVSLGESVHSRARDSESDKLVCDGW